MLYSCRCCSLRAVLKDNSGIVQPSALLSHRCGSRGPDTNYRNGSRNRARERLSCQLRTTPICKPLGPDIARCTTSKSSCLATDRLLLLLSDSITESIPAEEYNRSVCWRVSRELYPQSCRDQLNISSRDFEHL